MRKYTYRTPEKDRSPKLERFSSFMQDWKTERPITGVIRSQSCEAKRKKHHQSQKKAEINEIKPWDFDNE
jgi:hypothetical protein